MEMNLNNTTEAYDSSEALPQEKALKINSSRENCSCDINRVCDSCRAQNCKTRRIAPQQKLTMCRLKNQSVDSHPNQNCDTDSHPNQEYTDKDGTEERCLSDSSKSPSQNGDNEKEGKVFKTVFSTDCNTFEESSETTAPVKIFEHSNIIDSRRTRRTSKRKRDIEDYCPVCGVTVRYSELASHYAKEVENLSKISKSLKKIPSKEHEGVNTTFVQVKSNRQNRHAAKVAMFSTRARNEVFCPVCNVKLTGPQDEINSHVLVCINEDENYEEINVVDDDEDSFEEYEFADQTRIRAISMVPGGYRSLHGNSSRPKRNRNDDEEDLNVDVDDTLAYGNPQYTELDVIHNPTDDADKEGLEQLRKAVLVNPSAERHVLESRKWNNNGDGPASIEDSSNSSLDNIKKEENGNNDSLDKQSEERTADQQSHGNEEDNHVVSSLKEKIKNLEEQNKNVKCLICLEPYTKPVVSTTCWHVHCEECWLMTMGVKKLCPQCNIIVSPSDLRRIYL